MVVSKQKWVMNNEHTIQFQAALFGTDCAVLLRNRTPFEQAGHHENHVLSMAQNSSQRKTVRQIQGLSTYSSFVEEAVTKKAAKKSLSILVCI